MTEPQPVSTNLQLLTNFTIVAVGVLYTVGLLIVNTNLARYGLTSLNLARAEYVLAGALWVFLTTVTSSAWDYVGRQHTTRTRSARSVSRAARLWERVVAFIEGHDSPA